MEKDLALIYYDGPDLGGTVMDAIKAAGGKPGRVEADDLALLDEYHELGRSATLALANMAGIQSGEWVLDLGAGLGGPSRVLSRYYGAKVTALDATARFCEFNRIICDRTGTADKVTVVEGDARDLPFDDELFDVVWTQAVWQNIEHKSRVVDEIRRVLRPRGRLALFEVVAGGGGELIYPVPWADGAAQSFLVDAHEMRRLLEAGGFTAGAWLEGHDVFDDAQQAVAAVYGVAAGEGVPSVTPELLMPDYEERMENVARSARERRIDLLQAVLTRP